MRKIYFIGLLGIISFSGTMAPARFPKGLEWLVGKWSRVGLPAGESGVETWDMEKERLVGCGVTMKNGDTTFVELLTIEEVDDAVFYKVRIGDQTTHFRMAEMGRSSFRCVNPQHDFPKEIRYERKGNCIYAEISGEGRSIPFVFEKME